MMIHVYEATRIHIIRAMVEGPGPSDAIWGIFMSLSSSSGETLRPLPSGYLRKWHLLEALT